MGELTDVQLQLFGNTPEEIYYLNAGERSSFKEPKGNLE